MTHAHTARLASAAAVLALLLAGCGSGGSGSPTTGASTAAKFNPSGFILITVRNDTSSAVSFDQCVKTCNVLHEHRPIAAGSRTLILGLNSGTPFADAVDNTAGRRLGCVYMKFDHVMARPVVLVSSMTRCK